MWYDVCGVTFEQFFNAKNKIKPAKKARNKAETDVRTNTSTSTLILTFRPKTARSCLKTDPRRLRRAVFRYTFVFDVWNYLKRALVYRLCVTYLLDGMTKVRDGHGNVARMNDVLICEIVAVDSEKLPHENEIVNMYVSIFIRYKWSTMFDIRRMLTFIRKLCI